MAQEPNRSQSGLEFKLHPLVLVNVSDHHTRTRFNTPQSQPIPSVLGCLIGSQTGRSVDIVNSFEIKYTRTDVGIEIDIPFLLLKQEQYKKVFPNLDIVGWYATGSAVEPAHLAIQQSMVQFNESPVFFLMDPTVDPGRKELPVLLFESEVHMVEGQPEVQFALAKYVIDTSEAERIAVDQVAKMSTTENASGSSQVSSHLLQLRTAVQTMQLQLGRVLAYVDSVASGQAKPDHTVLRKISAMCRALPIASSERLEAAIDQEYTDAQLISLLSTLTKGVAAVEEFKEHVAPLTELSHSRGGASSSIRSAAIRGAAAAGMSAMFQM